MTKIGFLCTNVAGQRTTTHRITACVAVRASIGARHVLTEATAMRLKVYRCGRYCFFFQAEDGIRGRTVTGVQTCALPISAVHRDRWESDASSFGPVCPQPVEPRIPIDLGAPQGDDCLTLNVWASSDVARGDRKSVV